MTDYRYDVFISYSRKDTEIVDKICEAFDRAGITYFIDRKGLGGGLEFPDQLAYAINHSRIFLLVGSKNSYTSKFANSEITYAFNKKERNKILPYIIDKSHLPDGLEFMFSSVNIRTMAQHPIDPVLVNDVRSMLGEDDVDYLPRYETTKTKDYRKIIRIGGVSLVAVVIVGLAVFGIVKLTQDPSTSQIDNYPLMTSNSSDQASEGKSFTEKVNGVDFPMIFVEGGSTWLGATEEQGDDSWDDEKPKRYVNIKSFCIGQTEVTQAQWKAVMGSNPSFFKGDDLPVENISWDDAQQFIKKLNQLTGRNFRLPTEAEWEYASRGGKLSASKKFSGSDSVEEIAWYNENADSVTHKVASKKSNELGLYDMSGNVREWCSDWYSDKYYSKTSQNSPQGPDSGTQRVHRGGSWNAEKWSCRVSDRGSDIPEAKFNLVGLRLAL